MVSDGEVTAGVELPAPPDDDDGFDTADVPVDVVALALTDAEPLCLGLTEDVDDDLAEGEEEDAEEEEEDAEEEAEEAEEAEEDAGEAAVDAAAGVGAGVQDWFGAAPGPFLPGPAELVLVLVLWVGLARGVAVAVPVPLGLGLGLTLGLAEELGLELVALPLLWLPLDDVAGAVVVWVAPLGGLVPVCAAAGCVDVGAQGVAVRCAAAGALEGPAPSDPGVGTGLPPLPSVVPAPLEEEVLMLRAEPMALTIVAIP